jgi:hypothetical protein
MKKKIFSAGMLIMLVAAVVGLGVPSVMAAGGGNNCTTIQDGLLASNGDPIVLGYDEFGYNYQAHMFNGRYCDYDRVAGGDSCDVNLIMKWNDAWLSNKSCDGDPYLDRHYGYDTYRGSGAWLTNLMRGREEGAPDDWVYFVKIVAVPDDAYLDSGVWYTADDIEIGPSIWGEFAIIQEVESGLGATYVSPVGPGFGKW